MLKKPFMEGSYEVTLRHIEDLGTLVMGNIPLHAYAEVAEAAAERLCVAMTNMLQSPGIARFYNASHAFVHKDKLKEWKEAIEGALICAYGESEHDLEMRWFKGLDTGLSSLSIFAVLASAGNKHEARHELLNGRNINGQIKRDVYRVFNIEHMHLPADLDDWQRCNHLLKNLNWQGRLNEVVAFDPRWGPLAENWEKIACFVATSYALGEPFEEAIELLQDCIDEHVIAKWVNANPEPEPSPAVVLEVKHDFGGKPSHNEPFFGVYTVMKAEAGDGLSLARVNNIDYQSEEIAWEFIYNDPKLEVYVGYPAKAGES